MSKASGTGTPAAGKRRPDVQERSRSIRIKVKVDVKDVKVHRNQRTFLEVHPDASFSSFSFIFIKIPPTMVNECE